MPSLPLAVAIDRDGPQSLCHELPPGIDDVVLASKALLSDLVMNRDLAFDIHITLNLREFWYRPVEQFSACLDLARCHLDFTHEMLVQARDDDTCLDFFPHLVSMMTINASGHIQPPSLV